MKVGYLISESGHRYDQKITKMKSILKLFALLLLILSCSKDEGSPQEESKGYNMLLIDIVSLDLTQKISTI